MKLGQSTEEDRPLTFQPNEVGLFLLGIVGGLHPLIPAFARHNGPAFGPKLLEEFSRCNGLDPGIDWGGPFPFRSKGRPSPADGIYI